MKTQLDHLVVVASTLDIGVSWCEATFGITPGPGGEHAQFGTHNRLFKIATPANPLAYLEIIAVNAGAARRPDAPAKRWFDMDDDALRDAIAAEPRLVHFVAGTNDIQAGRAALRALDIERGLIMEPWTMPGWNEVPIVEALAARFGRRVTLDNDANVAALGEHWLGAGRGYAHMVYVTVSTGIGSGVIVDNRLLHGFGGNFGEVGLMTIDMHGPPCFEGSSGAWEHLASGTGIARSAREQADPAMLAAAGGDPDAITAALVARLAGEGHAVARAIIAQEAEYLGVGLANLMVVYAPQVIVMGGGVMKSWSLFYPAIEQIARARTRLMPTAQRTPVVRARLGLAAGFIGAARMAFLAAE